MKFLRSRWWSGSLFPIMSMLWQCHPCLFHGVPTVLGFFCTVKCNSVLVISPSIHSLFPAPPTQSFLFPSPTAPVHPPSLFLFSIEILEFTLNSSLLLRLSESLWIVVRLFFTLQLIYTYQWIYISFLSFLVWVTPLRMIFFFWFNLFPSKFYDIYIHW